MLDLARSIDHHHSIGAIEYVRDTPKYRRLLRPIGAYFDRMQARNVTLAEFESGFFWHFFAGGDLSRPIHGEIAYDEVPELDEACKRNRIGEDATGRHQSGIAGSLKARMPDDPVTRYSNGYEEILRSLSVKFDSDRVSSVLLVEGVDGWLLRTCFPVPIYVQVNQQRLHDQTYLHDPGSFHDYIYQGQEIADLITTVRGYRGMTYLH